MVLSDICIRRPVFATVMSLIIVLVGLVSYKQLSVREYPKIDEPVVTVDTKYPGASSEVVESQITKPLEDSIAGIDGIDVLTSISRAEQSQITVRFRLEKNPDSGANDVRDRVSRVRSKLPQTIEEPVIAKVEADASPIIWLAFSSTTMSSLDLTDVANRIVKPRMQLLPGAADVRINGDRKYSMRIWLDRNKLAAQRLTPPDVEDALRRQNVEVPAGRIESMQREFSVVSQTDLTTPEEFENIIVRNVNGYAVRLKDVARVEIGPAAERSSVRFNGGNAVALGVIRQATANPLELAAYVKAELPKLNEELKPQGIEVGISYDSTVFIDRSIKSVYHTIGEAVVLVGLVIFVFLRSFRASIIPLVTIPVSLIGAFALMSLAGFSINTLTLLALVLAIGLVVDDAIVVLENIYRHIEEGMKPFDAALKGAKEIGFAVIAMTMTLAAVYAPVAFTPGRTGRLFIEFALTLAGAVIVSGFVALTLSPMMCSVLLKHQEKHGPVYRIVENGLNAITAAYRRMLVTSLSARWLVVLVYVIVIGGLVWLGTSMKKELAPIEDRGVIFTSLSGPDGASLDYTQKYALRLEDIARETKEIDRIFIVSGSPTVERGIAFFRTVDWEDRNRSTLQMVKEMQPKMAGIPGLLAFPNAPPSLGQSARERPVNLVVMSSAPYQEMQDVVQQIVAEASKNPGLANIDTDLRLNKPQVNVTVDRDKAADAGVQIETVGRILETMLGGRNVTRFKKDGEQYDVVVQIGKGERNSPEDINNIFVRSKNDQMIALASLLKVQETVAPRELNHFGQRRAVVISANLANGYTQGEALDFMEATAQKHIKPGYATDLSGSSREYKTSSGSLMLTFVLALAFIYLVLAAQFESFIDPFIIMLTVPLSMAGALGALQLSGGTLNVYSQIGLITLVGLITKHGILIVEFTNQLREQGKSMHEAIVEAAELRLRPILMTTGAMVLGAMPLALATGAGAESRIQIGWVIVGGMSFGTLLTLFVVPTVYTFLSRQKAHMPAVMADAQPVASPVTAH
ncbi:efflux RND transporter permease subunit [Noviherbaspirillum cavernae]|uniref:Efflux RND transporter permease subunit n=1 Tax=Noviherbaspirillum cavernae TaxID=2320862 RepID=A0A418X240_9BURK|nr:efflux RND transporter permease subunit [Noviherbaspirillum cavernae]RJG06527.1 efflux RND transporter permease subunit [Noviherbaspirillum cavernae]